MSLSGISSPNYAYINIVAQSRLTSASKTDFINVLSQVVSGNATADSVLAELKNKFGAQVYVETLPDWQKEGQNFQNQLNNLGSRTVGTNNIVIAPNILVEMASDPKAKQHYLQQIQSYFDSVPSGEAFLAAHGRQIVSSGVIVHEDGTVTSWCYAEATPEEKARLERQMKEEDEAKAKKYADQKKLLDESHLKYTHHIESMKNWGDMKPHKPTIDLGLSQAIMPADYNQFRLTNNEVGL